MKLSAGFAALALAILPSVSGLAFPGAEGIFTSYNTLKRITPDLISA
jgi:hypothetical protein